MVMCRAGWVPTMADDVEVRGDGEELAEDDALVTEQDMEDAIEELRAEMPDVEGLATKEDVVAAVEPSADVEDVVAAVIDELPDSYVVTLGAKQYDGLRSVMGAQLVGTVVSVGLLALVLGVVVGMVVTMHWRARG